MVITAIKNQKRNKKRFSIFIDGYYRLSVGLETLTRLNLKEGDDLQEDFIKNILVEEEKRYIRERLDRILSYRDRSSAELLNRLTKSGFDKDLVVSVVEDYVDRKILNEERLVKSFVADYSKLNPKGNLYIKKQLKAKGINRDLIDRYLKERDEATIAQQFLTRKLARNKKMDKLKAYRLLINRGFTPYIVNEVIRAEFRD